MTMQGEEQQLMDQQMTDQQVQWINDSVQRDILLGDWKTKRASTNNRYPIIVFLVVFLVAAFLMIAAYSITVKAAPPSPEVPSVELYRQEMAKMLGDNPYDSIMSPESREQFEKLHSQADEIQNKAEQDDTDARPPRYKITAARAAIIKAYLINIIMKVIHCIHLL